MEALVSGIQHLPALDMIAYHNHVGDSPFQRFLQFMVRTITYCQNDCVAFIFQLLVSFADMNLSFL